MLGRPWDDVLAQVEDGLGFSPLTRRRVRPPLSLRGWVWSLTGGLAVFTVLAVFGNGGRIWSSSGSDRSRSATDRSSGPDAAPVAGSGGTFTAGGARFEAGSPTDVVLVAAVGCRATEEVFLLQPLSGLVYRFRHWPAAGEDVAGEVVATQPGAATLTTVDTDGDGCVEVAVDGPRLGLVEVVR